MSTKKQLIISRHGRTPERKGREYVKTGNVAVDSILNYKLEVIEKQTGCKPQLQIDIPRESMISEADLNIVLGNLLDNAGRHCRNLTKTFGYTFKI